MPTDPRKRARGRNVSVIALDPGETTGVCIISVDARWVRGSGPATWEGLGAAIRQRVVYQIGREPRIFNINTGRAEKVDTESIDEHALPIIARQPVLAEEDEFDPTTGFNAERFAAIMGGKWHAGGGELNYVDAEEVVQVRQIAGLLDNYSRSALVIEDFSLRTEVRSREVTAPDRLRASIITQEILHGEGRTPFLQTPAYAKTTAAPLLKPGSQARDWSRLKRAGLHFAGMPHATDAAMHAAVFMRDARQKEQVRAAAFPRHFRDGFDD